MATLATMRVDLRLRLDEVTARMWTDVELRSYLNEGLRDVARRTESLLTYDATVAVVAGTAKYTLSQQIVRIHRVEWKATGEDAIRPLQASSYQEMDSMWGSRQNVASSSPSFFVLWGISGIDLAIQLYPVPSQAGALRIYYYRMPAALAADADIAAVPSGWEDLVVLYAEYVAMRKDHDPRWQEAKQLYEERLVDMVNVTRQLHDQAGAVMMGNSAIPSWLYEFGD